MFWETIHSSPARTVPNFQSVIRWLDCFKVTHETWITAGCVHVARMIAKPMPLCAVHHHVKSEQDNSFSPQQISQINGLIPRVIPSVDCSLLLAQPRSINAYKFCDAPLFRLHLGVIPLYVLRPASPLIIPHDIGDMVLPPARITRIQMIGRA